MAYTVGDIFTDVQDAMTNRSLNVVDTYNDIKKAALELTETYKFPQLQVTGPTVNLTQYLSGPYNYNQFMATEDAGLDITNIDSFFTYFQTVVALNGTNGQNSGIPIKFKTIDVLEVSLNIVGQVINWTRHEGQLYFSFAPAQAYPVYCRYRREHPFSTPVADTDQIYMPNSWRDILAYAVAQRRSVALDLNARAMKFHNILYGDPKFQLSGGTEGMPGLIFMRTSQEQRDQSTAQKQLRLRMRSPQIR